METCAINQKPSRPVRWITNLPVGRMFAMRWWHRARRLIGSKAVATTYFGAVMECDTRDFLQATIAHFGVWEPGLSNLFERLVKEGDIVVDLGANIGYYSLLFAKQVGPSGLVVAVEALPSLADRVRRHAALNDFDNIRVANVAVSDSVGVLTLHEAPRSNIGRSSVHASSDSSASWEIPSAPLTDLLAPAELKALSFIKCDIEGGEIPVMRNILDNLDRFSDALRVEVETSASQNPEWPALFDRFLQAGFLAYAIPNSIGTLWADLLADTAEPSIAQVVSLPEGDPDILFTRQPLAVIFTS